MNPFPLINLKYTIHRLTFLAYHPLTRGLTTQGHEGFTMRGVKEGIGENDKRGKRKSSQALGSSESALRLVVSFPLA